MRWQTGVLFFTQDYDQLAVNSIAPFVLSPFVGVPVEWTTPDAALNDNGFGVFGQGTFAIGSRFEATAGVRFDNENKKADILTAFDPAIQPPVRVDDERDFSAVSPQFAAAFRVRPIMRQGTASSIPETWTRFATLQEARQAVKAMYHDDRVLRVFIVTDEAPPRFVEWVER